MAQSTARPEAAVDLQMVREFLERYFTIENEIKVSSRTRCAPRRVQRPGLDMKTMAAAIAIAKKRQVVPVSRETLDVLISQVEEAASPRGVTAGSAWKAHGACVIQPPRSDP